MPVWFYVLMGGVFAVALLSLWRGSRLPADGLPRALWCTVQIGAGLLLIVFAQIIALVRIAPEDPLLSFKDMFMPFRLWGQALRRAGRLYLPLILGAWGVAIILSACLFIGGLGHWKTYLPNSKNAAAKKA